MLLIKLLHSTHAHSAEADVAMANREQSVATAMRRVVVNLISHQSSC